MPYRLPEAPSPEPDSVLDDDNYVARLSRFASDVDPNPFFGRVRYVHGFNVDHPLAVVRYSYVDFFGPATTYVTFPPTGFSLFWSANGRIGS